MSNNKINIDKYVDYEQLDMNPIILSKNFNKFRLFFQYLDESKNAPCLTHAARGRPTFKHTVYYNKVARGKRKNTDVDDKIPCPKSKHISRFGEKSLLDNTISIRYLNISVRCRLPQL